MEKAFFAKIILSVMLAKSPAEKAGTYETWPENRETPAEKAERFEEISETISEVVTTTGSDKEQVFAAALLMAVSLHESGWAKHVETGEGPHARGDGGRSVCLMQINIGKGTTSEGWDAEDLVRDKKKCFTVGWRKIRRSFHSCKEQGDGAQLSAYAGGNCREPSVKASRVRMSTARAINKDLLEALARERSKG